MKRVLFFLSFYLFVLNTFSQLIFHQETFRGGITGAGFSTGPGSGSGTFSIFIETGSTIKKAWLFAQRFGEADSVSIIINSIGYNFNLSNQVTPNYYMNAVGNSAIHAIDITNNINPSITNYNITIPNQTNISIPPDSSIADVNIKYGAIYLWVEYENPTLSLTNGVILINNYNFINNSTTHYQVNNINPIDTTNPVGFATYTDRLGDTLNQIDGSYIYINSSLLGLIGGTDAVDNLWGGGVKGHFYYQNDSLFGLDDDTPDNLMAASDGLADISSYLNNYDTTFDFRLEWQNSGLNFSTNFYQGFFLTYTTPCDTFTTSITTNDTICLGDSVQLQATGGVQYSWFGTFGGLNDTTIANPMASPPQTTTYIATIKNDSGCVKTEQVKIWVNPLPVVDTLIVSNNFCGDSVGSITIGNIPNGTAPLIYSLTNLQTGTATTQSSNLFSQLTTNNYQLKITDANGCVFTDTANITETNIVQANFTVNPSSGVAPLGVVFTNNAQNANNYYWEITSLPFDSAQGALSQDSSLNTQYLFNTSGAYKICLIAYNNIATCADTVCKTIVVEDEISFVIPNVFTPNFDNSNNNFVIQVSGASLIKVLKVEIFNRWGMLVANQEFSPFDSAQGANSQNTTSTTQYTLWDGRTTAAKLAPSGTYFYVVSYTTINDGTKTLKGSITLLR